MAASGSGGEAKATFRIDIDGNAATSTKDVSVSARDAAKSITKYETEVKTLSADLRRLKGNSDETKAAKEALKKRIDQAKTSVSALTVELAKQNTSYAAATAATKKYGDGLGKLGNLRAALGKAAGAGGKAAGAVAGKVGGALSPVTSRVSKALAPVAGKVSAALAPAAARVGKLLGPAAKKVGAVGKAIKQDLGSVLPSASTMLSALGTGAAAAAAAVVAVGAAMVAGTAAFIGFGVAAADANAKMSRQREALLGNAKDAGALGDQIQALAGKVPQGVEELNALSVSLSKTRLSGKAIVSTMNAVAQATGAVDSEAGAKIQELVTRGQNTGRFALQRLELQGTGIDFDDVAKEYAAGTKKSIAAAKAELTWGQAPLEEGAAALARATEKKFGKLNLKNAFSLENAPKKFFDTLKSLTDGVDLEPLTKGFQDAFAQLQPNAPLGAGVRSLFTTVVGGFVEIAAKSIPVVLEGMNYLVGGALKLMTVFYDTKAAIKGAFEAGDWIGIGKAIVDGLVKGIVSYDTTIVEAVKGLAGSVKKAFTTDLQIHSPSRVFAKYGEYTTQGYADGVQSGSRRANAAIENMVDMPAPAAAGASSGGGGGDGQIVINITIEAGASAADVAAALQNPSILAGVARAVREGRASRGMATVTLAAPKGAAA